MEPIEIDLDEDNLIVVRQLDVCVGYIIEPGHDCDKEDHHTARQITVFVFRILDYDTDEYCYVAIPKESKFVSDLLDGTLSDELRVSLARFEQENP